MAMDEGSLPNHVSPPMAEDFQHSKSVLDRCIGVALVAIAVFVVYGPDGTANFVKSPLDYTNSAILFQAVVGALYIFCNFGRNLFFICLGLLIPAIGDTLFMIGFMIGHSDLYQIDDWFKFIPQILALGIAAFIFVRSWRPEFLTSKILTLPHQILALFGVLVASAGFVAVGLPQTTIIYKSTSSDWEFKDSGTNSLVTSGFSFFGNDHNILETIGLALFPFIVVLIGMVLIAFRIHISNLYLLGAFYKPLRDMIDDIASFGTNKNLPDNWTPQEIQTYGLSMTTSPSVAFIILAISLFMLAFIALASTALSRTRD